MASPVVGLKAVLFRPHSRHETSLLRSGITHNHPGIRANFRDGFARDSLLQQRVHKLSVPPLASRDLPLPEWLTFRPEHLSGGFHPTRSSGCGRSTGSTWRRNITKATARSADEVVNLQGPNLSDDGRFILNPAVDLEAATGFAAPYNRSERLKPVRAGAAGRAGGPSGIVSGLRSGCDTIVAPDPTAPQFLATAPGSRRSAGRRGVPCVGRHACC